MRQCSIAIDFYLPSELDWVNFAALDVDGQLYGYEFPPSWNPETGNWYVQQPEHRSGIIGDVSPELVPEDFGEYYWELD